MIIYIAGKIAGLEQYHENFNKVADKFGKKGHIVLNPATLPQGMNRDSYMPICMAMINACDAIYMIDGWEESEGAKLEKRYAEYQGKVILYDKSGG